MRLPALPFIFSVCLLTLWSSSCELQNSANPADPAESVTKDYDASRILKLRGSLKDSQQHALTGVFGVVFAVYDQKEGSAPVWLEVQNVEVDEHGRYSVLVGSTKSEGIRPELFAQEKTLWLGMQVSLPGEVEQPRFKLVKTAAGLRVDRATKLVFAENSGDAEANTQKASDETPGSKEEQGGPTDRPAKARKRFHPRATP